ncbi:MAG: hypothetical protein LBV27_03290, partial [Oscillospiraceae bacterium]|nr:hypothetical protein [Oscillospiraceae bacterium]
MKNFIYRKDKRGDGMRHKTEDTFARAVKNGDIEGVCLLYGAEHYLVDSWRTQITKSYGEAGDFNLQRFNGRALDVEALYDAVEALPLMARRKCVVADDLDMTKL